MSTSPLFPESLLTMNVFNLYIVSNSYFSVLAASLCCILVAQNSYMSADCYVDFIAEAQPNPAILTSFHTGTHQGQTNRAGRNVWRGQSEIQRAFCWLLFVPRSALASGILHGSSW